MADQLNMGNLSLGDPQQNQRQSYIPPHMRGKMMGAGPGPAGPVPGPGSPAMSAGAGSPAMAAGPGSPAMGSPGMNGGLNNSAWNK